MDMFAGELSFTTLKDRWPTDSTISALNFISTLNFILSIYDCMKPFYYSHGTCKVSIAMLSYNSSLHMPTLHWNFSIEKHIGQIPKGKMCLSLFLFWEAPLCIGIVKF